MSIESSSRQVAVATMLALILGGCAHKASPSAQIDDGFAPYKMTRNQAVALVGHTKRSLGAEDLNTLAVVYTALQEKANAYASFMVEAVTTSSFDSARNVKYSTDLANAIASFDKSLALIATPHTVIAASWVPSFAQTLQTRWNQYSAAIAKMTPQQKADLIADLKRATVWPNYEDIATEPLAVSHQ